MIGKTAAIDPAANREEQIEKLHASATMAGPVRTSEETLASIAEIGKIVEQQKDTAGALALVTEQLKKVQAGYAKTRPMPESTTGKHGKRSWDDVIYVGDPITDEEKRARDLVNHAMCRQIIRGNVGISKRRDEAGDLVVEYKAPPVAAWEETPEWKELSGLRRHIAQFAASDMWDTIDSSEWTPTGFTSEVDDFYRIRGDVLAALRTINLPRGVGSYAIPTVTSDAQAPVIAQTQSSTASFLDTAAVAQGASGQALLTPKKHMIIQSVSMEGEEDFVIDSVALMNREIDQILVGAVEQSVISGQTASQASLDVTPAVSGLISADGYADGGSNSFRAFCIANSFTNSVGGNLSGLFTLQMREVMGKFGVRPSEMALVTGPKGYIGMMQDSELRLWINFGPKATLIQGQLGDVGGVPIVVSDRFPELLTTAGVANGTGATTGAILFNRRRWTLGVKRAMQRVMLPQPGVDSLNMVGSVRTHFVASVSNETSTRYAINMT